MTRGTARYTVAAYVSGSCVAFARVTQRRAVVSRVAGYLADYRADRIHVTYSGPTGAGEVAQITNGGIWHYTGPHSGPLRAYVESLD